MTEPDQPGLPGPARREGAEADIAGMRIYYTPPDGIERSVDWDRRLLVLEAVALKKTAQMTPRAALTAVVDYLADPAATQAIVWMLRKFRGGERDLRLGEVDFDLMTVRDEWIDGDGVELDIPPVEEQPAQGEAEAGDQPADDSNSPTT